MPHWRVTTIDAHDCPQQIQRRILNVQEEITNIEGFPGHGSKIKVQVANLEVLRAAAGLRADFHGERTNIVHPSLFK